MQLKLENGSLMGFMQLTDIKKSKYKNNSISQKHKSTLSNIIFLCQSLGLKTCTSMRDDKFIIFEMFAFKKTK